MTNICRKFVSKLEKNKIILSAMHPDKVEQLLKLLSEEPDDPFLLYALALEYDKTGHTEQAEKMYSILLTQHSSYTPTYYHAATHYIKSRNYQKAKQVIEAGLIQTKNEGNMKAHKELYFLLDELPEDT
ncbi:MAG: tetratricopeptide repeat protein [Cytophagaceae bacterium]|nr:tetratricopeptide repeat protein [Cytophagaceae bacterium]MDW8456236.1 tetratricopeptide repeat protein [Cytophagaceae bacterium]